MKIIIIGSQGMLGQELAAVYQDHNPILWSRADVDITNKDDLTVKIKEIKPTLVFNAAAYNDVDGAEENETTAMAINGQAPGDLAEAVKNVGGTLVHYSTDYIFKGDKQEGYQEDDAADPQSVYAQSKLVGEERVRAAIDSHYIIRLSRLFGKPGSGVSAKKSFVEIMISLGLAGKEINAIDEELSSPTYAPDLAAMSKSIISQQKPFGTYHATNSGACTWYEFAKEIFAIKGIDVTLNPVAGDFFPRAAARPAYSILLNTKNDNLRSWQAALKDFLE